MTSFIYVVPVRDRWLVYSPLQRVSALVNQAAVRELCRQEGSGRLAELASQLHTDPERAPQPREGSVRPQFLGLIPTRACNLRCVYCGFGAAQAPSERMAPGLAVKAVNWMGEHAQRLEQQTLEVHFFGGEPFAAGDVVDVAVHRTRAVAAQTGLLPVLEVATNGVYREDRARFIGDYFDSVVLSFDGPREIHDRRRPRGDGRGSFEAVARTAHLLSQSPTELCFRICVAQDNVERLAEIVAWFSEEFQPSTIDFETLQPTPESRQAGLEPPDPYAFAVQYFRARRTAAQKGVEPNYAAALTGTPRLSFCPVGHDALIASPDGRISACYLPEREWQERGLDLHLGRLFDAPLDRAQEFRQFRRHALDLVHPELPILVPEPSGRACESPVPDQEFIHPRPADESGLKPEPQDRLPERHRAGVLDRLGLDGDPGDDVPDPVP